MILPAASVVPVRSFCPFCPETSDQSSKEAPAIDFLVSASLLVRTRLVFLPVADPLLFTTAVDPLVLLSTSFSPFPDIEAVFVSVSLIFDELISER